MFRSTGFPIKRTLVELLLGPLLPQCIERSFFAKRLCGKSQVIGAALFATAGINSYLPAIGAEAVPSPTPAPGTTAAPKDPSPTPTFKVSRGFSHALQKYTGVTWLTNGALSGIASTALSLKTHSLVRAKVRTYGFTDLLDGEFRSVDIKTNGGKFDGVPFGSMHVSTDTPFKLRYFQRKGHNSGLRTPVLFNIEGDMAEKDVSRALKSPTVSNGLRFLKLDLPGLGEQRLQVLQPKIDLRGDRVILDSFLVTAGADKDTGIPLHVEAKPQLDGERRILLKDMQIESTAIQDPQHFSTFADELLNPLIDFGRMDRFTHAFRMQKLNVQNERVNYSGRLLLAPKQSSKPTFSAPFIVNSQIAAKAAAARAAADKAAAEKAAAEKGTAEKTNTNTATASEKSAADDAETEKNKPAQSGPSDISVPPLD